MRLTRWIGIGALAAGLALGWAKHFARGQTEAPRMLPEITAPNLTPLAPTAPPPPTAPDIQVAAPAQVVEVSGTAPRPVLGASATLAVTQAEMRGKQEPAVSVEWLAPPTIRVQQVMNCQIMVRNTGPVAVQDVIVKHALSAGVVCRQTEPPAFNDQGMLVWTLGVMQPGQVRRLDLQLVPATRGELNCQATVTFSAASNLRIQVREPQLAVKVRIPDKIVIGDTVNVLVAVSNPGDGAAEQVKVKTTLPDSLDCAQGRIVELDLGTINPREAKTVQIACLARGSGTGTCLAQATGDGNLAGNDKVATTILEPKLELAVVGPKLRYLDRHALYVLKVSNPGTAPLANVTVTQAVPAGFKFHTATAGGRYEEGVRTVSWQVSEVPAGETKEVQVDLVATSLGDHRLVAQAASNRGVKSEATLQTRVEGASALVIELADVDDPVEVGNETAYEIRIANAGSKMETNLELVCTLPSQMELKAARCSTGAKHRLEGREVIFEPLPRLAPRADVIYRVTVRGTAPGDARFHVRVRADGSPEPMHREESTRFYNDSVLPK